MIKFKEYSAIKESYEALYPNLIVEYLTPDQLKKAEKEFTGLDKGHERRTNRVFPKGSNKISFPVENMDHDKSEVHREVEKHLGSEISREDYIKGLTKDRFGRAVKIGRMIKDDGLRNRFSNDNTRAGSKQNTGYTMSVHRGVEVFGQTNSKPNELHPNGHNWSSCKDINDNNVGRPHLPAESKHSVVVFAHDHDGKEIYRATLHPYSNEHGTMYQVNSEYGVKHPSFQAHANDIARRISDDHVDGNNPFYKINKDVYNDNHYSSFAIHPNASSDTITNHFNDDNSIKTDRDSNEIAHNILNHPNVPLETKKEMLSDPRNHRLLGGELPKSLQGHVLNHLLKNEFDEDEHLSNFLQNNENLSSEHVDKLIDHFSNKHPDDDHFDSWGYQDFIGNNKFNRTQINRIMNGKPGDKNTRLKDDLHVFNKHLPQDMIDNYANNMINKSSIASDHDYDFINRNGNRLKPETIQSILDHPKITRSIRRSALRHVGNDHFNKLFDKHLKNKDYDNLTDLADAAREHNTPELQDKALNSMLDDYSKAKSDDEKKSLNGNIFNLLNTKDVGKVSKETVSKFMKHAIGGDLYTGIGNHAVQFQNMSPKHIDHFIENGNDIQRHEISKRDDLLPRHIEKLRNDKNDGIRDRIARRFGAPKREPEEPTYNKAEHWS